MSGRAPNLIVVMMGVTGAGKSTIAVRLATQLGWAFCEGDDLHTPASRAKLAAGTPLDDADRAPWLDRIAAWITAQHQREEPGVITCSAIKRAYRDRLRATGANLRLVNPVGPPDLLRARLEARTVHFAHPDLLASQLHDLETPGPDEGVLAVDITNPVDALVSEITEWLNLV